MKLKKIISLLLVVLMVFGLAACGTPANNTPANNEANTNNNENTTPVSSHYPVTIENRNFALEKTTFTYEKAPERVITFWDNSLETMLALGLGDRIILAVGADPNNLLPELKTEYDKIKGGLEFYNSFLDTNAALSKEQAIMMEPDFILAWKSSFSDRTIGDTTYWNEKGVGTYMALNSNNVSENRTLENEYTDILNVGKIFDVEDRAEKIVNELKAEVERVTSAVKGQPQKSCIVIEFLGSMIWNYDKTMLAGNMVQTMGGNLLEAADDLGKEDIINLDPEVIFVIGDTEEVAKNFMDDPSFASLKAVQNKNVYNLPLSYVYTSGVRSILGLNAIGAALYPDLYK